MPLLLLTLFLLWQLPRPGSLDWPAALLVAAVLVLVPAGLDLVGRVDGRDMPQQLLTWLARLALPAGILLALGFGLERGVLAGVLAIPWLLWTMGAALLGGLLLWHSRLRPFDRLVRGAGLLYLAVGGVWAVADRLGMRPLGFDPLIVLMTAVHFHYAGFLLPLIAGLAIRKNRDGIAALTGGLVIVAIPLTAAGITVTQLGWGGTLETTAALTMAAGGVLTGFLHLRLAVKPQYERPARVLWAATAAALLFSMTLAALYALRSVFPLAWLNLPFMWMLHGTANAVGVGVLGVWGWRNLTMVN